MGELEYLPERHDLYDWIERWSDTTLAGLSEVRAAAIMVELNGLQEVQRANGHRFSDRLLAQIGGQIQGELPPAARCFNWHNSRILAVVPDHPEGVIDDDILSMLLQVAEGPHELADRAFRFQSAIGFSTLPQAGETLDDLITAAQQALENALKTNRTVGEGKSVEEAETAVLLNDLHNALKNDEFFLKYQPQFSRDLRCSGAEALIRWEHPERGTVSPGLFLPLAERSGLIHFVSNWVFKTAFERVAEWQDKGYLNDRTIALNVSPTQLTSEQFPEFLKEQQRRTEAEPDNIEIEITEKTLDSDPDVIVERLESLQAQGYSVALDDFGTGYSSVQRLADFPLDRVKVDRSLLPASQDDERRCEIVRFLIRIADVLDLDVFVEGVETDKQLEFLQQIQCQYMQGFYFEHPLNHDKLVEDYLREESSTEATV